MNSAFTSCCAGAFVDGAAQAARGGTRVRAKTTSRVQSRPRLQARRTTAGRELVRRWPHQTGASPENTRLDPAGAIGRSLKPYHRIYRAFSLLLLTYSCRFTRIYRYLRLLTTKRRPRPNRVLGRVGVALDELQQQRWEAEGAVITTEGEGDQLQALFERQVLIERYGRAIVRDR
jgi:hypothetical protein